MKTLAEANLGWGAPRIHGELLKLGIEISERTVSRLMPKRSPAPSQTWRTFLDNHVRDLVSIDFFTVPTAKLRVLFVFIVLSHERRRLIHFNITEHPTAAWTAQQIVEAFPEDQPPRYLVRDRDGIYGEYFQNRVQGMGIHEVRTAPRSPWQNPYAERVIGSIRRECLNHVIVFSDKHLRRILNGYFRYYHESRTHLSLNKDAPESRGIQANKLERIFQIPQVRWTSPSLRTPGGLARRDGSAMLQSIADFLYLSWHLIRSLFKVSRVSGAGDRGDAPPDCSIES